MNIKLKAQLVYLYYKAPKEKRKQADYKFTKRLEEILKNNYNIEEKITKHNVSEWYNTLLDYERKELEELWIFQLKNWKN